MGHFSAGYQASWQMLLFTFKASNVLISLTWAFPQRVSSSVLTGRMSPGYTGLKTSGSGAFI